MRCPGGPVASHRVGLVIEVNSIAYAVRSNMVVDACADRCYGAAGASIQRFGNAVWDSALRDQADGPARWRDVRGRVSAMGDLLGVRGVSSDGLLYGPSPGRLSALAFSTVNRFLYGDSVWARRVLTCQKRRLPARAVDVFTASIGVSFVLGCLRIAPQAYDLLAARCGRVITEEAQWRPATTVREISARDENQGPRQPGARARQVVGTGARQLRSVYGTGNFEVLGTSPEIDPERRPSQGHDRPSQRRRSLLAGPFNFGEELAQTC